MSEPQLSDEARERGIHAELRLIAKALALLPSRYRIRIYDLERNDRDPLPMERVVDAAKAWRDTLFSEHGFTLEQALAVRDNLEASIVRLEALQAAGRLSGRDSEPAAVPEPPRPAPSDPDPEEVLRLLEIDELDRTGSQADVIDAAARAYLRMREELARLHRELGSERDRRVAAQEAITHPALTIEQVIEATGAISLHVRWESEQWLAWIDGSIAVGADSAEAALRKLYDDAIAELREQRDTAAAKLQALGVKES